MWHASKKCVCEPGYWAPTAADAGRRRAVAEVRQDVLARLAALHAGGARQALQLAGLMDAVFGTRVCRQRNGVRQPDFELTCAGRSCSALQMHLLQD